MKEFTTVAHEAFYYDQSHFIHDFNFFAGCSPSHFLSEKMSMKQILTGVRPEIGKFVRDQGVRKI
jgi:AraC-like DNA-binding protein